MEPAEISAIAQKMAKAVLPYIKAQIKKDAANRYSLTEDWALPLTDASGLPAGEYHGEVVNLMCDGKWCLPSFNKFESTKENNYCDGASKFPDVFFGIDLRPGSVAHDTTYREAEEIAKAFGVPVSVVLKFADNLFTSVNLAENRGKPCVKTVSTMVHWGVRMFGGIYHAMKIVFLSALLVTALAGCAGCVSTFFQDEDDYESPKWEKVED